MYHNFYKSKYRKLVVGADTKIPTINGENVIGINFDNAATTPPFCSVINEIVNYAPWYSSIHRGGGYKSLVSSRLYEDSRKIIANFVGADSQKNTVIYVKNTTEAINKLSNRLCDSEEGIVLSSDMEHHSNDLPWRNKYKIDYIEVDECGKLNLVNLEEKLEKYEGKVKLVTVTGASNVTGYVNPIHLIAKLSHKYNAKILVDGAQLVPHIPVNIQDNEADEHIDYLVFSAHKMYAPFGIGVLIGPKETFEAGEPDYKGGGTVDLVTHDNVLWAEPPSKDEAGSPNVMGIVALVAAIRMLEKIDMKNVEEWEKSLTRYAISRLKNIPNLEIYCSSKEYSNRVGIIPFNIKGINHKLTAKILSYESGIAVRDGCFCAQPYVQKLLKVDKKEVEKYIKNQSAIRPGMVRISFGIYNDFNEIDILVDTLYKIANNTQYYIDKYSVL